MSFIGLDKAPLEICGVLSQTLVGADLLSQHYSVKVTFGALISPVLSQSTPKSK
jgi:hypothetical protein